MLGCRNRQSGNRCCGDAFVKSSVGSKAKNEADDPDQDAHNALDFIIAFVDQRRLILANGLSHKSYEWLF